MPQQNRGKKIKLFNKHDGRCYYCGCKTVVTKNNKRYKKLPTNTATVEHLYSKRDIRRYTEAGKAATVLCCRKCNSDRATRENCVYSGRTQSIFHPPIDIRSFLAPTT